MRAGISVVHGDYFSVMHCIGARELINNVHLSIFLVDGGEGIIILSSRSMVSIFHCHCGEACR